MRSARCLLALVRGVPRVSALGPPRHSAVNLQAHLTQRAFPLASQTSHASSQTHQTGSDTGQSGPSEEAKRRARNLQLATGAATAFLGGSYILYLQLKLRAASDEDDEVG